MKKTMFLLMAVACLLTMVSCNKASEEKGAVVEVTVQKDGKVVAGETVYQFTANEYNSGTFVTPFHAKKQSVTDENGVATFELKETFDLSVIDEQTTFYYIVFAADQKTFAGKTAVTIKKGETKQVTINL